MFRGKLTAICCIVIVFFTVAFIWFNSSLTVEVSTNISNSVTESVTGETELGGVDDKGMRDPHDDWFIDFSSQIRKIAHFLEFFLLGTELSIILILYKKIRPQWVFNLISFALMIAIADESIQILSDRGPKIEDVLLDLSGTVSAVIVVFLIYGLLINLKKKFGGSKNV